MPVEKRTEAKKCPQCNEIKHIENGRTLCASCRKNKNWHRTKASEGLTIKYPKEYTRYKGMKGRCYNKNNPKFKNYGARGIKVSDRWLGPDGFKHFLEDMGTIPSPECSIDRINVNGDYCPENCRWANSHTQANNKTIEKKYSNFRGVSYNKKRKFWTAVLQVNKKRYSKSAKSEDEAILARRELEKLYGVYVQE